MERDTIKSVWVEGQIDADGIGFSLISEGDEGAVVEAVDHYTFEELQDMEGEFLSLNLSDDSREILSEQAEDAVIGRIMQSENLSEKAEELPNNPSSRQLLAYMGHSSGESLSASETGYETPSVGDVVTDGNPADWSDDDRIRVVEVTETPADEYVIQESEFGRDKTVAEANPSEPADAPVIVGNYVGSEKEYAFPVTRFKEYCEECDSIVQVNGPEGHETCNGCGKRL